MEAGSQLTPSLMKLATPTPSAAGLSGTGLILVTPDLIGTSAITLTAAVIASITVGESTIINGPMNPASPSTTAKITVSPGRGSRRRPPAPSP